MAYSEATVLAGGLVHIPILIGLVGFFKKFHLTITKGPGKADLAGKGSPQPTEQPSPPPKVVKKPARPRLLLKELLLKTIAS